MPKFVKTHLEVLCWLGTFLNALGNTAYTDLKYSSFHSCLKLRQYKGKLRDQVHHERGDSVFLSTMSDKHLGSCSHPQSLLYGLCAVTPFNWHVYKGHATICETCPPTESSKKIIAERELQASATRRHCSLSEIPQCNRRLLPHGRLPYRAGLGRRDG